MKNYLTALSLAFLSVLILMTTASVSGQNQTANNQSGSTNATGTYNLTSSSLDSLASEEGVGQISRGGNR